MIVQGGIDNDCAPSGPETLMCRRERDEVGGNEAGRARSSGSVKLTPDGIGSGNEPTWD